MSHNFNIILEYLFTNKFLTPYDASSQSKVCYSQRNSYTVDSIAFYLLKLWKCTSQDNARYPNRTSEGKANQSVDQEIYLFDNANTKLEILLPFKTLAFMTNESAYKRHKQ